MGAIFYVSDQGERSAAGGAAKPLRPRKLGQSFGPEPLCRFATSPPRSGESPHCVGRLLRGQSPREKPPLTGEVAAKQAGRAFAVRGGRLRRGQDPSLRGATNGLRTRGAREGGSPPPLQWAGAAVPGSPPFPRRAKADDACAKRGGQRFYGEAVPGLRQRRRGGSLHGPCASRRG